RFLAVEGVTGQEEAIGREVVEALTEAGVPRAWIRFDDAHTRIPLPTQTGNLIVTLPGTRPGPRRLFMTHLDTVPLCAGARPVRRGKRIEAGAPPAAGCSRRPLPRRRAATPPPASPAWGRWRRRSGNGTSPPRRSRCCSP